MASDDVEILAEGRFLALRRRKGWEFVERRGARGVVAIIAINAAGELILTEQWREPIQARVLDLPAGLAGDVAGQEDEPLERAAARELVEEVGYEAERFRRVADAPTSPGLSAEIVTFFVAEAPRRVSAGGGEGSESIVVHAAPLAGIDAWLEAKARAGVVIDMKVYAGLDLAGRRRG